MSARRVLNACVLAVLLASFLAPTAEAGTDYAIVVAYENGTLGTLQVQSTSVQGAVARAKRMPRVAHAEADVVYTAALTPNDPLFPAQTQLTQVGMPAAWDTRTSAADVIVAVLDSGVDTDNPEITGNLWTNSGEVAGNGVDDDANGYVDDVHGWNFIEKNADPRPQLTPGATPAGLHHGTVVAGVIGAAGNNASGIAGMAWDVQLLPVRVLDSTGSGSTVTVAQGISYATAAGADVINLSFVGTGVSATLQSAIQAAHDAGVVIVAAAGNENVDVDVTPMYPACYSGVIGVGSVSASDLKSSFSNYGSCVDIVAPGENVTSTLLYAPASGYSAITGSGWYGTSVASPYVSGAAALVRAATPSLHADGVAAALRENAVSISALNPGYDGDLGSGRLHMTGVFASAQDVASQYANVLALPRAGDSPRVREYSAAGKLLRQFYGAPQKLRSGAVVRSGDVTGDGIADIITATLAGSDARVRVYDRTGKQIRSFLVFPTSYRGGVSLAVGDVNGDGMSEVVVSTETGSSHVRVFSGTGQLLQQFFAFTKQYRGGVSLAVGDVNGDGTGDIVAAKRSQEARITAYTYSGKVLASFLAFPRTYRSGVSIAVGDVTGDGVADIVAGAYRGSPTVRVLSRSGVLIRSFLAYDRSQTGGVSVAVGDVNGDGTGDIVTGTGPGAKPEVRVWGRAGQQRLQLFNAYTSRSRTGIDVSTVERL